MPELTRRRLLAATAGGIVGLAGCAAGSRESPPPATPADPNPESQSRYTDVYEATIESVAFVGDEQGGGGSGFVYDDFVVTNQHVIADLEDVNVRFRRGEWRDAGVIATDVYADLAVLSTDIPDYAMSLPLVETVPPVGTEVLALGSPFGLESSVSAGIISGKNRSPNHPVTDFSIPNTVQTDAGLEPGNSGGPVVTMDGDVTGIAVAGAGANVGFAISPLLARRVLTELIQTGNYEHPYLGIQLIEVTPTVAEANDLDEARGVLVVETAPDGPPDQTLRGADGETVVGDQLVPTGGDVIVGLAGSQVDSNADLGTILALELSPGDRTTATVIRDGERQTIDVPIGVRPEP